MLTEFEMPREPDGECVRTVLERVMQAVQPLQLPQARLERMESAVNEAVQNAISRVDPTRCELQISLRVLLSNAKQRPRTNGVSHDEDLNPLSSPLPASSHSPAPAELPAGSTQSGPHPIRTPQGWGFFLIEKKAGACRLGDEVHHTIELFLYLEGEAQ